MILLIDTANPEKTKIALISSGDKKIDEKIWSSFANQSEELLGEINTLLSKNKTDKRDLRGILVNPGPGSYTGIRVGVTTANFLGLSLNIPVLSSNGDRKKLIEELISTNRFESVVLPDYQNDPKITHPKARQ